jgi:hypothetical protein
VLKQSQIGLFRRVAEIVDEVVMAEAFARYSYPRSLSDKKMGWWADALVDYCSDTNLNNWIREYRRVMRPLVGQLTPDYDASPPISIQPEGHELLSLAASIVPSNDDWAVST